jgi:hypothetical protein
MYERFISSSMLTGTRDWVSDMRAVLQLRAAPAAAALTITATSTG